VPEGPEAFYDRQIYLLSFVSCLAREQ